MPARVIRPAVMPTWVVPADQQVIDCGRLAAAVVRAAGRGELPYEAGVLAAVSWVRGASRSPITDEAEPATAEAVEAEWFAAGEVELGGSPRGAVVPADAAQGVRRTLAWLLGREPRPPVPLPRRPVPTAEELYVEALAAQPYRAWLPEEREAARSAAARESARLARLAARADALA